MNTFVGLLRGINVAGKNILPMKELTLMLEVLGYEKVRTYIQSGNLVFSCHNNVTASIESEISLAIKKSKGFEPKVMILRMEQLKRAIDNNPFSIDDGKVLHFFFLESLAKNPNLDKLTSLQTETEQFLLKEQVFYLYAPDGIGRSKLAAAVEKSIGVSVTARNWNTVAKLSSFL